MAKGVVPAFSTGEVSPEFTSSLELEKARNALYKCENMIVDARGGVKNRPGTQFIAESYSTSNLSRLIPFQFNTEQAYVLEFSATKTRVFKDGALVLRDLVKSGTYQWTLSGSGTSEYYLELSGGGDPGLALTLILLENGIEIPRNIGGVGSLSAGEWDYGDNDTLGFNTFYVRLTDSTDPDIKADGYVQIPVEITTPYTASSNLTLDYTQSADVLYLFHTDFKPRKMTRTSDIDWTVTELDGIDGPYKGRESGDEDIRINATFFSGTTWTLTTSDSSIFDNVSVDDPIRLGFPVPGDLEAIHWSWFIVSSTVSSTVIRADFQGPDEIPHYEQVLNGKFKDGLVFWKEKSDANSTLTYDFTNQAAVLTDGAAGDAKMEQSITTFSDELHALVFKLFSRTGTSPTARISVGTASGLSDILSWQTVTDTATHVYDVVPTQSTVFINIDTNGSTDTDVIKVEKVSFYKTDTRVGVNTEFNTTDWRVYAWNVAGKYPEHGIINEQSLFCAKTDANPQTTWKSKTGDFEDFGFNTPILSTDSFSFEASTTTLNGIEWLTLLNGLNIGTSGELWKVYAASGGVITPTDVNIKIDNAIGTLLLKPLVVGNSIIMTPRGKSEVAEVSTSFEAQGFIANDLSILASHLFENRRIIRWAYARSPDSIIWCILDNGELLGITYYKEYDIWAWHRHNTSLGEGFKDVTVIPNSSDDNIDDVYFIVNRAESGDTPNYYIEQLNRRITPLEAAYGLGSSGSDYDYRFLDSALTLDSPLTITAITKANPGVVASTAHGLSDGDFVKITGVKGMTEVNNVYGNDYIKYKVANKTANTFELNDADDNNVDTSTWGTYLSGGEARKMVGTISGFDHLEGESITILGDGSIYDNLTISSGSVTLPGGQTTAFAHGGIPYTPEIETLDLELLTQQGSTQGRLKSITMADIYFKNTRGAEVATSNNPDTYWPIDFQDEAFDEWPPPLFTGSKETKAIVSGYDKSDRMKIRGLPGLPLHIKRIIWDVDYGG